MREDYMEKHETEKSSMRLIDVHHDVYNFQITQISKEPVNGLYHTNMTRSKLTPHRFLARVRTRMQFYDAKKYPDPSCLGSRCWPEAIVIEKESTERRPGRLVAGLLSHFRLVRQVRNRAEPLSPTRARRPPPGPSPLPVFIIIINERARATPSQHNQFARPTRVHARARTLTGAETVPCSPQRRGATKIVPRARSDATPHTRR